MNRLCYDTFRAGWGLGDTEKTMTVGELIAFLKKYDENEPVLISFEHGSEYGGVQECDFEEREFDEDEEWF